MAATASRWVSAIKGKSGFGFLSARLRQYSINRERKL
jgi:hypothetical protein